MLLLTKEREAKGMNKSDLARKSKVQASVIGWIESGRFTPYESQLQKIADALGWDKDPMKLLDQTDKE